MIKLLDYSPLKRTRLLQKLVVETATCEPSTFHIVYIVTASGTVLLSRRKKCSPDIKVDRKRNVEVNGDGHDCKRLKVAADATALRPPAHIDEESDVTVTNPLFIALHSPMDVEPNSSPDTLCSTPKKDDLGDITTSSLPDSFRELVEERVKTGDDHFITLILSGLTDYYQVQKLPIAPRLVGPFFAPRPDLGRPKGKSEDRVMSDSTIPLLGQLGKVLGRGRTGVVHSLQVEGFATDRLAIKLTSGGIEGYCTECLGTGELHLELQIYQGSLKSLQGTVVPECFGMWQSEEDPYTAMYGLVLDHAGEPLEHVVLTPTDKAKIRMQYLALHKAGVRHGSPKRKHWYRSSDGGIRLIDFGSASQRKFDAWKWGRRVNKEIDEMRCNLGYMQGHSSMRWADISEAGIDERWGLNGEEDNVEALECGCEIKDREELEGRIKAWRDGVPPGLQDPDEVEAKERMKLMEALPHSEIAVDECPESDSQLSVKVELVEIDPPLEQLNLGITT